MKLSKCLKRRDGDEERRVAEGAGGFAGVGDALPHVGAAAGEVGGNVRAAFLLVVLCLVLRHERSRS